MAKKWMFDQQVAVNLITGRAEETFPFQQVIYTYLFLYWCRYRDCDDATTEANMRRVASAVAFRFLTIKHTDLKLEAKSNSSATALHRRTGEDWYRELDLKFIQPVGRLTCSTSAPSFAELDKNRKSPNTALLRELAIPEFFAMAVGIHDELITRNAVRWMFNKDILGKGIEFYGRAGKKKTDNLTNPINPAHAVVGVRKSAADKLWDGSSKNLILIYSLWDIVGPTRVRLFSSGGIFQRLQGDDDLNEKIRKGLRIYTTIMRSIEKNMLRTSTPCRWRVVCCPDAAPIQELPRFTGAQRQLLTEYSSLSRSRLR
jgi:hypothetical protein